MTKTIIYIVSRNLLPTDSGDKLHTFNILKNISRKNKVILINLLDEGSYSEDSKKIIDSIVSESHIFLYSVKASVLKVIQSLLAFLPFSIMFRRSKEITSKINEIVERTAPDLIIWDHLRSTIFYQPNRFFNILFEHNNEFLIYKNRAKGSRNILSKLIYYYQAYSIQSYIDKLYKQLNRIIFVSSYDVKKFKVDNHKFFVLDRILLEFPHEIHQLRIPGKNPIILFTGSLDWEPNVHGILWFVEKVFRNLDEKYILHIVGRNPKPSLTRISHPRIKLFANVASMEPYYSQSDYYIAPIFIGAGINIKILEALSYGIPLIPTPFSLRGYGALDFLQTFTSPEECISLITNLQENPQMKSLLSKKELDYYHSYISESATEIEKFISL